MAFEYIVLALVCFCLFLIAWLFQLIREQQRRPSPTKPKPRSVTKIDYSYTERIGELSKELSRLLYGDSEAASRLIKQTQNQYPNQSTDWIMSKVITDLERDRGR